MKLSTRSRYGLRALLEVAASGLDKVVLRKVCENQDLSPKYLERIFSDLKKGGILVSVRGAGGGFHLARDPALITVLEIVNALEKGFGTVDCVSNPLECDRSVSCSARKAWARVAEAMHGALRSLTLADLLKQTDSGGKEPTRDTGGRPAPKAGRLVR